MEAFAYKGISDGKYVEGDIEALNLDEASHKLKEQKIIITNLVRTSKKRRKLRRKKRKKNPLYLVRKKPKSRMSLYFQSNLLPWLRPDYRFYRF